MKNKHLERLMSEFPFLWAIRQSWSEVVASITVKNADRTFFLQATFPAADKAEVWLYRVNDYVHSIERVWGHKGELVTHALLNAWAREGSIKYVVTVEKDPIIPREEWVKIYRSPNRKQFVSWLNEIELQRASS